MNIKQVSVPICKIFNLPLAKIVKNKLYILNTNGQYIRIKQKKPKFIENISELKKYK